MTFDELRHLQVKDVMRWPTKTKAIAALVLIALMGIVTWIWFISPENDRYHALHAKEESLKNAVREKQRLAANLPAYQAQIQEMNRRFERFLQQLPNRSQIPSLLDDVTLAGRSRGLEFELFQPLPETKKDFYAEIPVKIKVVGSYDEIGRFVAAVAAMPRIVTIHDIDISRVANTGSPLVKATATQKLVMQCTATTYRYLTWQKQQTEGKKP
jgi:type IV pilus assembly protein PilO